MRNLLDRASKHSLTELVNQLEIVNNRDSISQLCALSEKDLIAKIEDSNSGKER